MVHISVYMARPPKKAALPFQLVVSQTLGHHVLLVVLITKSSESYPSLPVGLQALEDESGWEQSVPHFQVSPAPSTVKISGEMNELTSGRGWIRTQDCQTPKSVFHPQPRKGVGSAQPGPLDYGTCHSLSLRELCVPRTGFLRKLLDREGPATAAHGGPLRPRGLPRPAGPPFLVLVFIFSAAVLGTALFLGQVQEDEGTVLKSGEKVGQAGSWPGSRR
jgi:hypothetical protein